MGRMAIQAQDLTADDWETLHYAVERNLGEVLNDHDAVAYANAMLGTFAAAAYRVHLEASELGRGLLSRLLRRRIARSWVGPAADRAELDGLGAIVRLARDLERRAFKEA